MARDTKRLGQILKNPVAFQPIQEILDIINKDPTWDEPYKCLVDHYKNSGRYVLADMFLELYANAPKGKDHDHHTIEIDRSIIGFYLSDPIKKEAGHRACESLSLDPGLGQSMRQMSRNNLRWYAKPITEVVSGATFTKIQINNGDGYKLLNPSIARWRDELWMIQRTVNYELTADGNYVPVVDDNIRTKNWLCKLDHQLNVVESHPIGNPRDWPTPRWPLVLGFEDSRLFVHDDQLWTSSTVRELNEQGLAQMVLARLDLSDPNGVRYCDWKVMNPIHTRTPQYEKNWMPIADQDQTRFVYGSDPIRIIDADGQTTLIRNHPLSAEHWRGGSQAIPFKDGYLFAIHETVIPSYKERTYLHRFVWCDSDWRISRISDAMILKSRGIEFISGMAAIDGRIIMSFGYKDSESWLMSMDGESMWDMLRPIHSPVSEILKHSDLAIGWAGTALLNGEAVSISRKILTDARLPSHADVPKNWDNFLALHNCLLTTSINEPILDVGATSESAFLPGLQRCGYENLVSINLNQPSDDMINGISYRRGDITATDYPDEYFGFVSCLSVIEHGVPQDGFFREVNRILKDRGRVAISTDYWSQSVDTSNLKMFDADMVVFTPPDIDRMIKIAGDNGFTLLHGWDPKTDEAVIVNMGVKYTFAMLIFEKVG